MKSPPRLSPDEIARRCAELMWPADSAAQGLGIRLVEVGAGRATLTMSVRPDMVNVHGNCHGGYLFALADTAFGYACNSQNQRAVTASSEISFLAPAQLGDLLTAQAHVRQQGKRRGVYDVEVTGQNGLLIALCRGHAARIAGHYFEPDEAAGA